MRFEPHGRRTNRIEGRILISTFEGPFNVELLRVAGRQALEMRSDLMREGPWGYVEVVEKSAMATPEALAEMKNANLDPERCFNRVAAAVVVPSDVEGVHIGRHTYQAVWRGVAHPFKLFDEFTSAYQWVAGHVDRAIAVSEIA